MAEPQQKSLEIPFLWRIPTLWQMPQWAQANQWRWFVYNQPIAMLCRQHLINHMLELPQEVIARDPDEQDKYEEDCNYYNNWVLADFDHIVELLWQDSLDLPVGGNSEIIRWPQGFKPDLRIGSETYKVTGDHPKGHPYKIVNIDGATLFPTYDEDLPIAQRIPELDRVVYFGPDDIMRIGWQARPEMRLRGYYKAPPEQVYLAMKMVNSTDHYYNDLLEDVPPVGILDLMDMAQNDATDWAGSVRALFEGNDPFKIPILYQHEKPATFIPFGKSPQELLMDTAGRNYSRITASSYGLTLGNLGLEPKGETLAGSIRDDSQAESGKSLVVEKTKGVIDGKILPPYLEWKPKITNYERLTARGRAFLVTAQALKATADAKAITPSEMQSQLVRDGFITIDVQAPNDEVIAEQAQQAKQLPFGGNGKEQAKQLTDRMPPDEGGLGDVKKEKAEYKYASTQFDMPDNIIRLVQSLQAQIDTADLTEEDGLEANPHVTIKYGLTNDDPEGVRYIARQFQPFYISLGDVSLFTNDKFDVVKIEIEGDTLRQLNKAIAGLGSVDTHPGYNPHLTLAYVKPGTGEKYLSLSAPHQSVMVSTISFSTSDGYITKIPLGAIQQFKAKVKSEYHNIKMADSLKSALDKVNGKATPARLGKLIKAVTHVIFPITQKAGADDWQEQLDKIVSGDSWYLLPDSIASAFKSAYEIAYSDGATAAAEEVLQFIGKPAIGIDFNLSNPRTLAQLEKKAATLVTRIDEGTRFYLKRAIVSGVEEGLASPEIAQLIRDGAGVEEILKQGGFVDGVAKMVKANLDGMTPERVNSIVNTEVNRAESEGRLGQWSKMGLTRKQWVTDQNPCDICKRNEAQGFVEMAYVYEDVFDGTLTPPGHPQVCHCHLEFDEKELMDKAGELEVWEGD